MTDLNGQNMDGSGTDMQQKEHRHCTIVTEAMKELGRILVRAMQQENGNQNSLFANVRL